MNHKALINRFVFFWNDENNLFSSATLNLVLHLSIGSDCYRLFFSSPIIETIAFNRAIATSQDERKQKVVKK